MQKDCLIIGQGICGSWLHFFLEKAGFSCLVIDESLPNSASKVAAGIINPVTGRRIVKTWMIDQLLPFALQSYTQLGIELNADFIAQKNIVDFFPTPQMKLAFMNRYAEDPHYLSLPSDENNYREQFHYEFGYGEISPCYLVNLQDLINQYRKKLMGNDELLEERFDISNLQVRETGIQYKEIKAERIIFCDGIGSASSPYFKNLPFAPNKGEAIWVEIPGLPEERIFKRGYNLVPLGHSIFWLGSTYLWEFEDDLPTPGFHQFAGNWLKQTIKLPFKIIQHQAAVRPATLERRPFIGFHPVHKNVGMVNGMGTKGCSLAPYFAWQLVQHIQTGSPIIPEADIRRFSRILQK